MPADVVVIDVVDNRDVVRCPPSRCFPDPRHFLDCAEAQRTPQDALVTSKVALSLRDPNRFAL